MPTNYEHYTRANGEQNASNGSKNDIGAQNPYKSGYTFVDLAEH